MDNGISFLCAKSLFDSAAEAARAVLRLFAQQFEQNEDGKMKAAMNV